MKYNVIKLMFTMLMLSGNLAFAADNHPDSANTKDPSRTRVVVETIKTKEILKDQSMHSPTIGEDREHQNEEKIKLLISENLKLQETVKISAEAIEDYKKLAEARKQKIEELEKAVAELKKQVPAGKK